MFEQGRYAANCSLLFREYELLARPAAARAAGFDAIEYWWPFAEPVPDQRDVDAFVTAIERSGTQLVGLNFYAGDLEGPDCGVLSLPDRAQEFVASLDVAIAIGERLGVPAFNALYGNRVASSTPAEQDAQATKNLAIAAAAAQHINATVLVEAISGPKPYPLRTAEDVVAVVDRLRADGSANVGFLCDVYHLAANHTDPVAAILRHPETVAHVQIADFPGRGEPGTGEVDLARCLEALELIGYEGWIGLEYAPSTTTADSLGWLVPADGGSDQRTHSSSRRPS